MLIVNINCIYVYQNCSKDFACTNSFNPQNNSIKWAPFFIPNNAHRIFLKNLLLFSSYFTNMQLVNTTIFMLTSYTF